MRKKILIVILVLIMALMASACRQSERVSYNISKDADNFNVVRRLAVINTVSGEPIFELIGRFSLEVNSEANKISVIVETEENVYKKHIIGLNSATTMYVVEDIDGANVSKYKYEINYLPKMIQPFTVTSND